MSETRLVVLCTCPDDETAMDIAARVVDAEAAACVNVLPQITSVFRWKDQVDTEAEVLLIIKTNQAAYARLEDVIRWAHPYELPEIVAVPIERGLEDFLQWIDESVHT